MHDIGTLSVRSLAALALAASLAGCASGPGFKPPAAPPADAYSTTIRNARTDSALGALGGSQTFVAGSNVSAEWWRALGSPKLDTLIRDALAASPTVDAAEATLRQAEELYRARAGSSRYPQVDATVGTQRQRFNPSALGQGGEAREFSLFNATVAVRYRLDLAGGDRRALEALAARTDYRRYQLDGARLTLAATIAGTAVSQAKLAAQLDAMEAVLRIEEQQLDIARQRLRLGAASPDEVLALQRQSEQTRAGIPPQRKLLQQGRHLLAALAGRVPGDSGMPAFAMTDFTLPADVPLVVPSELVRRRPDIRAAEALMQAANADYGGAVAKLYPQLNLSASMGSQALSAGTLFGAGSAIWNLVAQLTQPLLNPGLRAEKRASLAAFDAAAANYQGVVLESLRNMADVLAALGHDAQALAALASAEAAAQAALASTERQYSLGAASYPQVLSMHQQLQQARINLVAARAQRLVDSVALYQAIGGGADALTDIDLPRRNTP